MKYETPVCEVILLNDQDVIATSGPIIDWTPPIDDLNQNINT